MKLVKATYEQIYPTGYQYLHLRLGGEVILEDGETMEDGWGKLKADADEMHKKLYPHLYESTVSKEHLLHPLTPAESIAPIPEINIAHERLEVEIDNAKTTEELKALFDRVLDAGSPAIGALYNKKLKELQGK